MNSIYSSLAKQASTIVQNRQISVQTLSTMLSECLEKWQFEEINNLLINAFKEGGCFTDRTMSQIYLFATDLAKHGASYDQLFQALRELLNLVREEKSYDQSVFLVTEQFGVQSSEAERIMLFRYVSDVLTANGDDPNYKHQQAAVDDFVRYFIQECPISAQGRWEWIQQLLDGTAGLQSRFEDRVALITATISLRMRRDIPDEISTSVIITLNTLLTIGVAFDDAMRAAIQPLVQTRSSLFHVINEALKKEIVGGPAAAA